jgi:hypothetical protein
MATVDAMKIANKEMKKQYKNIDIDKIEVGPHYELLFPRTCVAYKQLYYSEHTIRYGGTHRTSKRDPRDLGSNIWRTWWGGRGGSRSWYVPLSRHIVHPYLKVHLVSFPLIELEALGEDFGEEEEMPSYLRDSNALPDFIDEAPVPAQTVSLPI